MNKLAQVNIGGVFDSPFSGQAGGASVGTLVTNILSAAISIAGLIALFMIIGSGIAIIASAGSGDKGGLEKAKNTIKYAVLGFFMAIFAFIVLQFIERFLGAEFVTPGV